MAANKVGKETGRDFLSILCEMFYLKDLAEDCLADNTYEFLLVAASIPITGAVGTPINPLAIK